MTLLQQPHQPTGVKPGRQASSGEPQIDGPQRFPCSNCDTSGRCTFACFAGEFSPQDTASEAG